MGSNRSKSRVAVLGTGYIANYHAQALRGIDETELAAACDVSPARAQQFAGAHGISSIYGSLEEMLKDGGIDCVHVCTPADDHYRSARAVLSAGLDVYVEKPVALSFAEAEDLADLAERQQRRLGVGHNFLYSRPYLDLKCDLAANQLGKPLAVDIIWSKPLAARDLERLAWLSRDPRKVLFEIGPHLFAHALDLVPSVTLADIAPVRASDNIVLGNGQRFARSWNLDLTDGGSTRIRLTMSFVDGFTEHYLKLRGTHGAALVDFERNVYVPQRHTNPQPDLDGLRMSLAAGAAWLRQGMGNAAGLLRAKAGSGRPAGAFAGAVWSSIRDFHAGDRQDGRLAAAVAALAEQAVAAVEAPEAPAAAPRSVEPETMSPPRRTPAMPASVLVTGAGGFIGRHVVRRLASEGLRVRALVRPGSRYCFDSDLVDTVEVDLRQHQTFAAELAGVDYVIHLARGDGRTWAEYVDNDVEITRRLAEGCVQQGAQLIYASSIAIYSPHQAGAQISEGSGHSPAAARGSLYARAKVRTESMLRDMETRGLRLVIVRPGIVVGGTSSPLHPGVAEFPYSMTFCTMVGDGNNALPIVLVDDCADAMSRIISLQRAGTARLDGESFNLVGDPILTANEYLEAVELTAGMEIQRRRISPLAEWAFGLIKYTARRIAGASDLPFPSLRVIRGRAYAAQIDNGLAKRTLGWEPCSDREALLERGVAGPAKAHLAS